MAQPSKGEEEEKSTQSTKGGKTPLIATSHAWLSTRLDKVFDLTNCRMKTKSKKKIIRHDKSESSLHGFCDEQENGMVRSSADRN